MTPILHAIYDKLGNQFVSGGLVLMFTGSLIALARQLPSRFWLWMKRRFTSEVEVINNDPLFDYVTFWLNSQPYSKKSRKLTATTANCVSSGGEEDVGMQPGAYEPRLPKVLFSPAPGTHFFFFSGRLLRLERTREKPGSSPSGTDKMNLLRDHETYSITVFGRRQKILRVLIDEIVKFGARPTTGIRIYYSTYGYWQSFGRTEPRSFDSVILPPGIAESLIGDARRFLSNATWYRSVGIPWHRGYLLYGLAGSGKSSIVAALAGELRMDLYLLNIGGSAMGDEKLSSLMSDVRPGSIVLMEDIDCTAPGRDETNKAATRVTLSGLLNCLDGVMSREGCLIFMTTNFVEQLDDALVRPGRVDYRLEFDYATEDQKARLAERIGGTAPGGLVTMSQVQQALMDQRSAVLSVPSEI